MLTKILVYSRADIKAEKYIHTELKKIEINKITNEIYCLLNSNIFKISFNAREFFQSRNVAGIYINDFSISMNENKIITGGWEQSYNPPLKLYKIQKDYGKFIWVKTSYRKEELSENDWIRERIDRYGCPVKCDGEEEYTYVKFISYLDIIIAVSGSNIIIYDINGILIKKFQLKSSNICVDVFESIVYVSDNNILIIYDLNLLKCVKEIDFSVKIKKIKIIENTDKVFVVLNNLELFIIDKYQIKKNIKINKEVGVLENDSTNSVIYFGNYFGEFGAIDYDGNIIYEDKINDTIRDILVVNKGDNIIVASKNVEFYIYERKNKLNISKEINFKKFEKRENMKKIFLSYCWKNEETANSIDNLFNSEGIKVIRDKHDLQYRDSIKEFMEKVRDADFVIMLISKEYLESINCMYEVLEFIKDNDFKERIIPLVHKNTNIFKVEDRVDYINYWDEEYNKLKEKVERIPREASAEISDEIKKRASIKNTISEFISIIADMNNILYTDQIESEQFAEIIKIVDEDNVEENLNINDVIKEKTILTDMQKNEYNNLYLSYIDKWCDFADISNWRTWTSWMLGSGQPHIFIENWEKVEKLREWLFSRIWPNKLVELEDSFENFRLVLNDLYNIFNEHYEKRGKMYYTEKFYHIDEWNEQRYQQLLGEYNFHVCLVQDLVLELTRAANYICDNIRKYINSDFRLDEGKLVVTYGPCMDSSFKTICPEYRSDERTVKPYPGLEKFKEIRIDRDHKFGIGVSCHDPEFLENE
ncbi:toll/interleukin-1 receptor domain-containing protein [Clostridium chromiireducens]|nr:toll/interleukin-1 receptor domain-containing protein [Clostridium chromiireducens]